MAIPAKVCHDKSLISAAGRLHKKAPQDIQQSHAPSPLPSSLWAPNDGWAEAAIFEANGDIFLIETAL